MSSLSRPLGFLIALLSACEQPPAPPTANAPGTTPGASPEAVVPAAVVDRTAAKLDTFRTADRAYEVFDQPNGTARFTLEPGTAYTLIRNGGPEGLWCKVRSHDREGWMLCAPKPVDGPTLGPRRPGNPTLVRTPRVAPPQPTPTAPTPPSATPTAPPPAPTPTAAFTFPHPPSNANASCALACTRPPLFAAAPALSQDARDVLALCPHTSEGGVAPGQVTRFVTSHVTDARIESVLREAGRDVSPGARAANVQWLSGLWSGRNERNAFTHVFCGNNWDRDQVGGLHFLPRYAELESAGLVCYDGPARGRDPVRAGQYTIRFHARAPWSCAAKPIGGFLDTTDPVVLLAAGTRAYAHCCKDGRGGGVFADDSSHASWRVWCDVRNGGGIASVYPTDEAATCNDR